MKLLALTLVVVIGIYSGVCTPRSAFAQEKAVELIPKPATDAQMKATFPLVRKLFESVITPGKPVDEVYADFPGTFQPHNDQLLPVMIRMNEQVEKVFKKSPVQPKKYQEWRDTQYVQVFRRIEGLNDRVTRASAVSGEDVLSIIELSMIIKQLESREILAPNQLQAEFALARTKRKLVELIERQQLADPAISGRAEKPAQQDNSSDDGTPAAAPANSGEANSAN